MDWISDLIAGVALVASGFSIWLAKTGPRRARQAALRDDLRRELNAFLVNVETAASEVRQGVDLSDVAGEMSSIRRRVNEFRGRLDVPGLEVQLLQANMSIFESEWFLLHNSQEQISSAQDHLSKIDETGPNGTRNDAQKEYIRARRESLQRLERALPGRMASVTKAAGDITSELKRVLDILNKADKQ